MINPKIKTPYATNTHLSVYIDRQLHGASKTERHQTPRHSLTFIFLFLCRLNKHRHTTTSRHKDTIMWCLQDTQASQPSMLSFLSQLRQTKTDPTGIFQRLVTYHAAVPCYPLLCPSASLNVPQHKTKNIQLPCCVRVSVSE